MQKETNASIEHNSDDKLKQIKSRERVSRHGEVFTSPREVKAMCDLVNDETLRIDSRFLEPACGDGNFLIEILERKLRVVCRKYKRLAYDYERFSLLALASLYGVEILLDNVLACRERLFNFWNEQYTAACPKSARDDVRASARFILSKNIICGNALTLHCVDENQRDTPEPIVFTEWSCPKNDSFFRRKEFTFEFLLSGNAHKSLADMESIFPDRAKRPDPMPATLEQLDFDLFAGDTAPDDYQMEDGSVLLKAYKPTHYRKLAENA